MKQEYRVTTEITASVTLTVMAENEDEAGEQAVESLEGAEVPINFHDIDGRGTINIDDARCPDARLVEDKKAKKKKRKKGSKS